MGMWSKSLIRCLAMRWFLLALSAIGILWPLIVYPSFSRGALAREITARLVADERFRPGLLQELLGRLVASPRPAIEQPELTLAQVLLRLRSAEEAMQRSSSDVADREVEASQGQLVMALSLNPTESFLWLLLYSVETFRNGFDPTTLQYLDRSYRAGPHEGWIAVRRNRLSLAILPTLDESLQKAAISEFSEMVDSDFIEDAAMILKGVGWIHRDRLLASLTDVEIASKASLLKRLRIDGISVKMPGIEYDERPWR